jgi:hypothetical protein
MSVKFKKCKVLFETTKALQVFSKDFFESSGTNVEWFPKSAIHDDSEVYKTGDVGVLIIKDWFAIKKNWV